MIDRLLMHQNLRLLNQIEFGIGSFGGESIYDDINVLMVVAGDEEQEESERKRVSEGKVQAINNRCQIDFVYVFICGTYGLFISVLHFNVSFFLFIHLFLRCCCNISITCCRILFCFICVQFIEEKRSSQARSDDISSY